MARFYWCKVCEDTHQRVSYRRNCDPELPQRGDYPTPHIVSDGLPGGVNGLLHHGVGRRTDSKSRFRQMTRDSGCIEVGNEYAATAKREYRDNISTHTLESGVNEALHRQGVSSESDVGDFIV
jgi:hypothetical protein